MVAFRSKAPSFLLVLVLILSILLIITPNVVLAQEDQDEDEPSAPDFPDDQEDVATPISAPAPTPAPVVHTPAAPATPGHNNITAPSHLSPPSAPVTAPTPTLPVPIFSTSDACVACQKEYSSIHNCSSHLPPAGVNLTMIVQLLPFYGCFCQNNYALIDGAQQCSSCFRSTGQSQFMRTQFYNVTNQEVKAYKKVCAETQNGSRVPSSAATGDMWSTMTRSSSWMVLSILAAALLPLSGL